jgi:predicted transcriptional regulator
LSILVIKGDGQMFGLGKPRTDLGKYLDRYDISQGELATISGISRDGISRLCDGTKDIEPNEGTCVKIVGALRRMGYDVEMSDFW